MDLCEVFSGDALKGHFHAWCIAIAVESGYCMRTLTLSHIYNKSAADIFENIKGNSKFYIINVIIIS